MITDELIDSCGFRMFELGEISRTMVMDRHPGGGDYVVKGNKREQMAQYGNAVTPPVMDMLMSRVLASLGGGGTFKDLFCGAGGSSIGATTAGGQLILGLNHWRRAIETHAENFPNADHDCADVSALTTSQIRRYPDSDILLASPECTNHSLAKGALRKKPQVASIWEDGPGSDDEQDRSRATMWDVCRFAEQKILKGKPYKAIIVENVVDAYRWGAKDNGGLFQGWKQSIESMGYRSEIAWVNSMFAWPTPQSRDRMYVVFWRKGVKKPDLRISPPSWCPHCEKIVEGDFHWKQPTRPLETKTGQPNGARYGIQYLFSCPNCKSIVLPGVFPAASAIDWDLPAQRIGERSKPLAKNTRERIRRGLERLATEPFMIRLLQGGTPRPLTLPVVTLTRRHDLGMVIPIAGNTFERTSGNRARDVGTRPFDTIHTTLDRALVTANTENAVPRPADLEPAHTLRTEGGLAMVVANRMNNVPRDAMTEPTHPLMTGGTIGIVELQRHGGVRDGDVDPAHTIRSGGSHHGVIMRNNQGGAEMCTPDHEPFRTLTARCHQSLIVPYQSEPHGSEEPSKTLTSRETIALVVPPSSNGMAREARHEPSFVQTTETRPFLLTKEGDDN